MIEIGAIYLLLSLCDQSGNCVLRLEQLPPASSVAECRSAEPTVRAWAARHGQRVDSYKCVETPR